MSIASQLTTLAANKAAIKAAIEAKNPETAPTDALAQWAQSIASIPSGGGLTGYTLRLINNGDDPGSDFEDQVGMVLKADGTTETTDFYGTGASLKIVNNAIAYAGGKTDYSVLKVLTGNTVVKVHAPCLLRGTLVTLADGSEKPIEEITYDDDLLVWDFERGECASAKPLWIKQSQRTDFMFDVQFKSGRTLGVTGAHGHRAFNLDLRIFEYLPRSVGDKVWTLGGADEVVSCMKTEGDFEYYNIITADNMNLFANGVLTSCRLNNYRGFNVMAMKWSGAAVKHHSRSAFDGIPPEWVDGLHLCEQPMSVEGLRAYVERLRTSDINRLRT